MFKTKVLNKHLALALTSGLLLMANAVNAESIGSITPNSEILKGNNVVVTQNTTGYPVFFAPSKDAYVVGDGSGTLTVNTDNTLGLVIFRAPNNYDQMGEGVNLKGNLVLNVNLEPRKGLNPDTPDVVSAVFGALTSMEILSLTLLSIQTARQFLRYTSRIPILPKDNLVSALQAM